MALLEVNNLHAYYGNIHALKGISLKVEKGEIVSLIGGNGAGKTTTLRSISGLIPPKPGAIILSGEDLSSYKAHELVSQGVAMVPEGRGVFAKLTVLENLEMGAFHRTDKEGIAADLDRVYKLFPRLAERKKQLAGTMSGGEQQMLSVARTLMSNPCLVLMDEPSEGVAPVIAEQMMCMILELKAQGVSVLLSEQNPAFAGKVADRVYELEKGQMRQGFLPGE